MRTPSPKPVTALLVAWGQGDPAARDKLIPLAHETYIRPVEKKRAWPQRRIRDTRGRAPGPP